jgi:hypothetical protein
MTRWVVCALFPLMLAATETGCGGRTGGGGSSGADGGRAADGGKCVDVPKVTGSDLACNSDEDCTWVWGGVVCYGGCACAGVAANVATQARLQVELEPVLSGPGACACPGQAAPRCIAHQCTVCGFGSDQPPGCRGDGGMDETEAGRGTGVDSGTFLNDAGKQCVEIDLSAYDLSCGTASDCIPIQTGEVCSGSCDCGGTLVNVSGQAKYDEAVSGLVFDACPCVAGPAADCIQGRCVATQ